MMAIKGRCVAQAEDLIHRARSNNLFAGIENASGPEFFGDRCSTLPELPIGGHGHDVLMLINDVARYSEVQRWMKLRDDVCKSGSLARLQTREVRSDFTRNVIDRLEHERDLV